MNQPFGTPLTDQNDMPLRMQNNPRFRGCVIAISAICLSIQHAWTAEPTWTGWLGPSRNGWVSDVEIPQVWPASLQPRWRIKVGTGYGSPLLSGGHVYQHARQNDQEVAWCIDLETGNIRWRQSEPTPFKMGGGGEQHGKGPKSCPVLADGRLFTLSITGTMIAREMETGDVVWKRDYNARFTKSHPYWGVSASPIVVDNLVIVHFGNDEQGTLVALDTATGKEVWTEGTEGASYSSPLLANFAGVPQIIDWNHNTLAGIEVATGELLWQQSFPHEGHNQNMPTPTLHQGQILLGAENRGMHSFEPQHHNGTWQVRENWHQPEVALDMSTAVMNDSLLYGFSHYNSGQLFCLNPADGKILWQSRGRFGKNVTFLSVPGHILALIDNGELKILSAQGANTKLVTSYRVAEARTLRQCVHGPECRTGCLPCA